ncbi:MAG: DUF4760 domain-containing protein [Solirubrobacterales bacterium]
MGLVVSFLHLDDLAYIATVVLAVATVALLGAAIWAGVIAKKAGGIAKAQIDEQRRIEMRRRAYDHLEVFGSREFTDTSAEASVVLQRFKEEGNARQSLWEELSTKEKTALQTFLNFYEEIAHEYNAGFLDPTASEPLVFVAVFMWQESKELVEWLRRDNRRFLEQWAALYRDQVSTALYNRRASD